MCIEIDKNPPNPSNRNQRLFDGWKYKGLPVMQDKGPFVVEYLEALYEVIERSQYEYNRVCAIRFDLRFPASMAGHANNEVMSRFMASLKAKIRHDRARARERNANAHDTEMRYVWGREIGQVGRVHYHAAILVNRDAYFGLGQFDSDIPNMANRIREAWASAMGLTMEETLGCVEFPKNPTYRFSRNDHEELQAFFHRASYLCKAKTKQFGDGQHGFGASRH
jgi:hypothetical protein